MDNFLAIVIILLSILGILIQWFSAGEGKTPVVQVIISNIVSTIIIYLLWKAYLA